MNPASLLAQARTEFKNQSPIRTYAPTKITDNYGYQYLLKGEATIIQGAIHTEKFLEENIYGRFNGASIILSTSAKLNAGDLIEANDDLYAIAHQKPFNDRMQEYDYVCYSLYDYYKEFIIDEREQAERILGSNSLRYILALQMRDIPILPSFFTPNTNKYIKVNVNSSQANSITHLNQNELLEQWKKDFVTFYAIGLDTNELLQFCNMLISQDNLGLTRYPTWSQDHRYCKEFDTMANIHRMELELNYVINGNTPLQRLQPLIKEAFCRFLK